MFEDAEKAEHAQAELNRKYIGKRWVELIPISGAEYQSFNQKGGRQEGKFAGKEREPRQRRERNYEQENQTVYIPDYVTHENCKRSVKLRGLPYEATKCDIVKFFSDFEVIEKDVIIDMSRGKSTGYALVFLPSEEDAARAIKELNN
jgi:heterogeneous nuclear ribonucleoprotein F/H